MCKELSLSDKKFLNKKIEQGYKPNIIWQPKKHYEMFRENKNKKGSEVEHISLLKREYDYMQKQLSL